MVHIQLFEDFSNKNENNLNDNFKKWFGNSKAIDKNGNPLIVYHGTYNEFDEFDMGTMGNNHHESKSRAHGGGFFFADRKNKAHARGEGGIIKSVYLKLENPLIRNLKDWHGNEVDYYHATDMFDNNSTEFFENAKFNNNDGIIITTPRGSLYVAFNPNQIKSVDNKGDWDIKDNNIYN